MSTTCASEKMEFRCTHCWHSNVVETQLAGNEVECQNCGHGLSVPEASPDRIARAEALLKEMEQLDTPPARPKTQEGVTDKELIALAQKEMQVPLEKMDFSGHPTASILARLGAAIFDNLLFMISAVLGVGLLVAMVHLGLAGNPADQLNRNGQFPIVPLIYFGTIPFTLLCIQWVLLSTCGQTIGKKVVRIRIVTVSGRLPGFLQGVFLRNWVRRLLGAIPFFSIIDLLFGLGESNRCLHDWIAMTRVVEVHE